MLETAETGRTQSRSSYERRLPDLRVELLNAQFDLREAPHPVLILLVGNDHIGCNATLNLLNEWMDARYLQTRVFGRPTDEERERPPFWRYWRVLPGAGELGLYLGAWPQAAIADRGLRRISKADFERRLDHIVRFEETLVEEGALLLKFWLHLPKKELGKRLARARKDPEQNWRVGETDARVYESWNRFLPLAESLLARSSSEAAPWHVIESTDERYRNLEVGETILRALSDRREAPHRPQPRLDGSPVQTNHATDQTGGILNQVDLAKRLGRDRYEKLLAKRQRKLRKLSLRARKKRVSSVIVFEGWDAAGKGGTIRRITSALEAADYRVVPIAAPTEEERAHHYLWRFWRHLPRAGHMLLFDRSWYGRVLVERVEGFAPTKAWKRAFGEIRNFEEQLNEHGIPVVKFWLHMDPDTQLERFKARETTPYKKHKITEDDYRNRERWHDYWVAIEEMIERTSTPTAPWHIITANDKRVARVEVLEHVCTALEGAL